jgi:hypothetical protein
MLSSRWSAATAAAKSSFGGRTRTRRASKGAIEEVWDLAVRDAKTGRLDAKLVRAAELAVQQFQARLLVGESPARATREPQPNAAQSPGPPLASAQTSLTMLAGFALALDPERGKYGSNRTRRYDQMLKYRERLFGGPRHAAPFA